MNRTDRLYALVEELRASAPRRRSARELAARYEVSVRTIERDIGALQQSGVPIYADVGRRGGYTLDKNFTLPPLNFTPAEAVAVAIALSRAGATPFAAARRSAVHKIVAAMSERDAAAARALAERVRLMRHVDTDPGPGSVSSAIDEAILTRRVLQIDYEDRFGVVSERAVEPVAFLSGRHGWYLVAWCRLRDSSRMFRFDRIKGATLTDLSAPDRAYDDRAADLPDFVTHTPALL